MRDPDSLMRGNDSIAALRENAPEVLSEILGRFNDDLERWRLASRCSATLVWRYNPDGSRRLIVTQIDYAIYRGEAPSAEMLESVLKDVQDETEI